MMENQGKEKKRAANIIWNASADYSFVPDFEIYDGKGRADIYWNYIIGAVRRYYDYPRIEQFFSELKIDPNHPFYEGLAWIGLENAAFHKGKKDRPVVEDLRRQYAIKVARKEDPPAYYFMVDEIKTAHFQRALGEAPVLREPAGEILDALELDDSLDTGQIIQRLKEVINRFFPLSIAAKPKRSFQRFLPKIRLPHFGQSQPRSANNPFLSSPVLNIFNTEAVDLSREINFYEKRENQNKKSLWRGMKDRWDKKQRESIQNDYGESILSEAETKALEQALCVDNHLNCHLHITRGEYATSLADRGRSVDHKNAALNQREKNKAYYKKNLARNSHSIERLTNIIRNSILVDREASPHRAKAGALVAGRVWRNVYLYDQKVFQKNVLDEVGNLAVDILLDASGSQMDRQEVIASEAYIIAESLTRCRIPVRIASFLTSRNFTVFSLFRDYGEVNKNDAVFHYHTSGCNRDGLAVRTTLHRINESPAEYKLLILLSDGKPLDPRGIPASKFNPDNYDYADAAAVNDTALEVRKGWRSGVSILCVFTGLEEDIPAAKKMYGNNMVTIKNPDQFADVVGILMKNVLKNI